jgi:nitroimidazol reductase NimA-like FMN-containing flavoprotein (pyridoxamine 5'-phosphate oxidase superfamily)
MEFNKIIRGSNRSSNTEQSVYEILDAGFLCHIAFQYQGQTMMIPTAYGRKDDTILIHGSTKNFMMNQLVNGQTACISVTHLDGIVLAKTLFDTSANYRSVVLFGKAEIIEDYQERMEALKIITENIIKGRWNEVPVGDENEIKATMLVKIKIDKASAKIRAGGPKGDENKTNEVWSGHIPLEMKSLTPIQDMKFGIELEMTESVKTFWENNK